MTKWPKVTSVFSAHHDLRKFSSLIHRTVKRSIPVTMTKVLSSEDNNSEDDAEDSGNGEEEEDITPDRRNAGRSTIESSFHKHERTLDMEYAESDSDLGADKERSTYPAHDDHNIPKEDNNHDEEAMDDNESTPKWELNLPERAQHLSRKQGGKTGFFFVYSNSLSP